MRLLFPLVVGVVAMSYGVALIVFRTWFIRTSVERIHRMWGPFAKRLTRGAQPATAVIVGVWGILIGLVLIIGAVVSAFR